MHAFRIFNEYFTRESDGLLDDGALDLDSSIDDIYESANAESTYRAKDTQPKPIESAQTMKPTEPITVVDKSIEILAVEKGLNEMNAAN